MINHSILWYFNSYFIRLYFYFIIAIFTSFYFFTFYSKIRFTSDTLHICIKAYIKKKSLSNIWVLAEKNKY